MLPFALLVVLLVGVPDVAIWAMYLHHQVSLPLQMLCFAPSAMAFFSLYGLFAGRHQSLCMYALYLITLFFSLPKILYLLFGWLLGIAGVLLIAGAIILLMLYGLLFGYRHLVVRHVYFKSDDLPQEFDNYRILQISDIHIGSFGQRSAFINQLVRVANEQTPDLIAFTGDLINNSATELLPYIDVLSALKAPDGVCSVMGNHDYAVQNPHITAREAVRQKKLLFDCQKQMEWRLLLNEHVAISRQDNRLYVAGVENIGRGFISRGNLSKALHGIPEGAFKVLLSHDPTHWRMEVLNKSDIQLTLSGHTHAGQIRIGRFSPSKWAYNEWGGCYSEQGRMLHVSCGVGGRLPFRLGAWPEINVINLKTNNN